MSLRLSLAAAGIVAVASLAAAQQHGKHHQPYAGQQGRTLSSLSDDEVRGFLDAQGMGLARAAELNGYPGPMHVLEFADKLRLSAEQKQQTQSIMDAMKAKGRDLGARYVAAERAIDDAFKARQLQDVIALRVAEAGRALSDIRMAHLDAHLAVTPLLSAEQVSAYAKLRGYGDGVGAAPAHKH